ncbi:MAG: MarR family winged helix-turn-helix transcriptional regulator [Proteobacteria bacterium]|nr:MarR family winged helix-turn-helix transcriptional regulator [Pseudomonadota bacterium]
MSRDIEAAHEVLRAIRKIVRRVSEHSKYLARESGLTMPQLVCLKAIGEMEEAGEREITVVMVSKRVQLAPATVSRIIDRLCRGELVLRERRARDRRKVCLSLSPAGLDRFHTLPVPLHERFVDRWMALDESERSQLMNSMLRITELMDATDLDAAPILAPGSDVKNDS